MICVKVVRVNLECGGEAHCLSESFVCMAVHTIDYFSHVKHCSLGKYSSHELQNFFIVTFSTGARRRCVCAAWMTDEVIGGRQAER
jgi:hypothetical protein